jgi:hypothetical protein
MLTAREKAALMLGMVAGISGVTVGDIAPVIDLCLKATMKLGVTLEAHQMREDILELLATLDLT